MKRDRKERSWHHMVDTITYIISTVESAYRFARGEDPFDFSKEATVEVMYKRNIAFIEDANATCEFGHKRYIDTMSKSGWALGPEDYNRKTMPDLISYDQLSEEQKEKIAFRKAIVESARDFYWSLRLDIESDLVNDMKGAVVMNNLFRIQGGKSDVHC